MGHGLRAAETPTSRKIGGLGALGSGPKARLVRGSLTPREVEVPRLLALGHTNRRISEQLCFSLSTIKNHVHSILEKLGVSDRTQAAARAVELGIVRPRGR